MHRTLIADDATEERNPAPRSWVPPPPKLLTHLRDERLEARVRAGFDRACEAFFERHHRPLLAFCRHLLGSQEEAEDALQHTFIAAHRALRTDERPVMLRAWLFTIARNRCLSLLRSRRTAARWPPSPPRWRAAVPGCTPPPRASASSGCRAPRARRPRRCPRSARSARRSRSRRATPPRPRPPAPPEARRRA